MKKFRLMLLVAIPALMIACNSQSGSGSNTKERSNESGMRGRSYDNDQDTVKQRRTDQSDQSGRSSTTPAPGSHTDKDKSGTQSEKSGSQVDQSGAGSTQSGTQSGRSSTSTGTQSGQSGAKSDTSRTTPGSSGTGTTPK